MSSAFSNINDAIRRVTISKKLSVSGRVSKYDGHFLECDGFPANLGSICSVATEDGKEATAEIIGFKKGSLYLAKETSDGQSTKTYRSKLQTLLIRFIGRWKLATGNLVPCQFVPIS